MILTRPAKSRWRCFGFNEDDDMWRDKPFILIKEALAIVHLEILGIESKSMLKAIDFLFEIITTTNV